MALKGTGFWLMKTEPATYSIDDLKKDKVEHWDGIRNYQARNLMRDEMKVGDMVLFYHSNAKPPGVVGLAEVASTPYPDYTAWDVDSKYFDSRSTPEKPVWMMVDVRYVSRFEELISLTEMRSNPVLEDMLLLRRGQRLSILPVQRFEYEAILAMAETDHND